MILYHYTCHEYLPSILEQGLTRGEVPISATYCLNAVWLTTDPSPSKHGLSSGRLLTRDECRMMGPGVAYGKAAFPDKRAVRVTVDIEPATLDRWMDWAPTYLQPKWLGTLNRAGGGLAKAKTWYLHWGTIPPDQFVSVDILRQPRTASPAEAA